MAASWVAVGFLNTLDFNVSQPDGAAISTAPKGGDILHPRWSANIRPGAAAWSQSLGVQGEGRCFKVAETRLLPGALTGPCHNLPGDAICSDVRLLHSRLSG